MDPTVSVRYMVDDVQAALDWYTRHLGLEVDLKPRPSLRGCASRLAEAPPERPGEFRRPSNG